VQDAVALALTFDRTAAAAVAARVEGDDALKRKLWLAIAQHLINATPEQDDADPVRHPSRSGGSAPMDLHGVDADSDIS
jgi:hypothetical protein